MRALVYFISFVVLLLSCGAIAQNLVDTIQSNINQAMKPAQEVFSQAMEPAKSLLSDIANPAQDPVQSFVSNVGNNIASVADQAGTFVNGLATNVVSNVNNDQNAIISEQLSAYHSSTTTYRFSARSAFLAIGAAAVAALLTRAVA